MTNNVRVGYIGLGLMGKPMARNLLKAGFALTVHNRSRAAVDELTAEGATPAASSAEVAARSEFIITCLPGPADVERVYLGAQGVLAEAQPGSVLIDMSTIDPGTHQKIAAAAAAKQCDYLDAPVSGGTKGAREGTLTIMVGGEAKVLARAQPVLKTMGERIYHLGPVGSGAVAKLINNLMAAINTAGMVEGLVLGAKAGLDPELLFDVVKNGSGNSTIFTAGAPAILARDFEPGFAADLMHKDVGLALDLARGLGVRLLAGSIAHQVLQETRGAGLGKKSMYAQILPLEENAGVVVKKK